MHEIVRHFECWMNNLKLKRKLIILYVFCVLIPLIATDSFIVYTGVRAERTKERHAMENDAKAIAYNLSSTIDNAAVMAKNLYTNDVIEDFLNYRYDSDLEYVTSYNYLRDNLLYNSATGAGNTQITIYSDNETIINGGEFGKISSISDSEWYRYLEESGEDTVLYIYYDDERGPAINAKRRVLFVRRMNFFGEDSCEKVIKIEIDYSNLVRYLSNIGCEYRSYVCMNDKIILSNSGNNSVGQDFADFCLQSEIGYHETLSSYGSEIDIYVLKDREHVFHVEGQDLLLVLLLLFINIVFPWVMLKSINRSFVVRIRELSGAFENVDEERLMPIAGVRGEDEIGSLMSNYNRMVKRMNELIQTVYKDKLREQEIDIARQKAELLALHSQINPHFLFNALESIRMHSVLRHEYETADMVEKLAIMERQNVDWGTDSVEIKREVEFVEAYLGLQKYRFGERLSYEIDVDETCLDIKIPKLTVVTFVENACVHGIESKTAPGWIFVRVYKEDTELCIEIEDTGEGLEEDVLADIQDKMSNASIERLQEKGRVGMLNACLRIKMVTNNTARFLIESEKKIGTMVQIRIPLEQLENRE